MVEVSRDGQPRLFHELALRRLGRTILSGRRGQLDGETRCRSEGGIQFDSQFFFETKEYRLHQIRLEGGDASSDSYCFP